MEAKRLRELHSARSAKMALHSTKNKRHAILVQADDVTKMANAGMFAEHQRREEEVEAEKTAEKTTTTQVQVPSTRMSQSR